MKRNAAKAAENGERMTSATDAVGLAFQELFEFSKSRRSQVKASLGEVFDRTYSPDFCKSAGMVHTRSPYAALFLVVGHYRRLQRAAGLNEDHPHVGTILLRIVEALLGNVTHVVNEEVISVIKSSITNGFAGSTPSADTCSNEVCLALSENVEANPTAKKSVYTTMLVAPNCCIPHNFGRLCKYGQTKKNQSAKKDLMGRHPRHACAECGDTDHVVIECSKFEEMDDDQKGLLVREMTWRARRGLSGTKPKDFVGLMGRGRGRGSHFQYAPPSTQYAPPTNFGGGYNNNYRSNFRGGRGGFRSHKFGRGRPARW